MDVSIYSIPIAEPDDDLSVTCSVEIENKENGEGDHLAPATSNLNTLHVATKRSLLYY